jgi:diphthamide biosynthesis protein 3
VTRFPAVLLNLLPSTLLFSAQQPPKKRPIMSDDEIVVYDEIEIEDMTYDEALQIYHYPCPCGDRFQIAIDDLRDEQDIAVCPSCSLMIRVIYDVVSVKKSAAPASHGHAHKNSHYRAIFRSRHLHRMSPAARFPSPPKPHQAECGGELESRKINDSRQVSPSRASKMSRLRLDSVLSHVQHVLSGQTTLRRRHHDHISAIPMPSNHILPHTSPSSLLKVLAVSMRCQTWGRALSSVV